MRLIAAAALAASFLVPLRAQDAPAPAWREIFRLDDKAVVGIGFSPDGKRLAISGRDYARVLSFPDGKTLTEFRQSGLVDEAVFSLDGRLLATRSLAEDTRLRDTTAWEPVKFGLDTPVATVPTIVQRPTPSTPGSRRSDCPAAYSPDGRWLALANGSKGIRFWNLEELSRVPRIVVEVDLSELETDNGRRTGMPEHMMLPHVNAISFAGRECWLGFEGGFAYPLPMTRVEQAYAARDGRAPAPPTAEDFDRALRNPDVRRTKFRTLEQKRCFRPHSGHVTSVELVGGVLVTAGWEGKVRFWTPGPELSKLHDERDNEKRPSPPKPLAELPGYTASASPDDRLLAIGEAWKVVLYDPGTRAEKQRIEAAHSLGRPVRLRFSPDGAHLAVTYCRCTECVDDGILRLTSAPPRRVHHHGGVLVVYACTPATPTSGK